MNLWQSAAGMAELELTSADTEGAISAIAGKGIPLQAVTARDMLTVRLWVRRKDIGRIRDLCRRRGEDLKLIRRKGIFWAGKALLGRPVLLLGLSLVLAATLLLPTRVFFLEVEGNRRIPARQILEAAEEAGLRFGVSRRSIRSERIKNRLLETLPSLGWVGVNTVGCRAVISVRERQPEREGKKASFQPIVAARDGVVTDCTVTGGSPLCAPGQAVREGQILISPYTDCGISIRVTEPKGEVYARTGRRMEAVCLSSCVKRRALTETKRRYSLILGKKRINLWKDSGIWDATCGRMYEEYYLTLPGGLCLPVRLGVHTLSRWKTETAPADPQTMEDQLTAFARRCVTGEMIAGTILTEDFSLETGQDHLRLTAEFSCREMIGRVTDKQIGDTNE